jgi:Cdc6-like AAA superfamily ATPase
MADIELALIMTSKLSQAMKDDTNSIQKGISTLQARVDSLRIDQNSAHLDRLKSWLSQIDSVAQQSDFLRQRYEGTGQWFLDTPEFSKWLHETNVGGTLFCTGIPGSGKTITAAVAIDHLITKLQKNTTGVAWVYCSYKSRTDQTVVSLFSVLLRQLMQGDKPRVIELVEQLHKRHTSQKTRPTAQDIIEILRATIMEFSTVCFVIDALDECSADDGTRRRFVKDLEALQSDTDLRLMITSRNIPEVVDSFTNALKVEVWAHDEDVKDYLAGQLDRLPRCVQKDAELQKEVQEKIAGAIDGMYVSFTLVYLPTLSHEAQVSPCSPLRGLTTRQANEKQSADHTRRAIQTIPDARNCLQRCCKEAPKPTPW